MSPIKHPLVVVLAATLPTAGLVGCIDDHHAHHPVAEHHDDHHDHHDDYHAAPYQVLVSRPPPPNQPPVSGPGHWVWDDTTQRYLWVAERQP